jgi:hypothetical protein
MSTESLRARLEAATPGPWKARYSGPELYVFGPRGDLAQIHGPENEAAHDADLIAHAPTDLAAALEVVEAALQVELLTGTNDPARFDAHIALAAAIRAFEALP